MVLNISTVQIGKRNEYVHSAIFSGLFYDAVQNEIGAEMAYMEANKLNQAAAIAMARSLRDEELAKERREKGEADESESDGHKGNKWARTCDFQQCGILTSVGSDEPVQSPFRLRNRKWCSVSSLTIIEYWSD